MLGRDAAPFVVGIGTALAPLGRRYAVTRGLGLPPVTASAAAALLAAHPVFIFTAIPPLSGAPAGRKRTGGVERGTIALGAGGRALSQPTP